MPGPLTAPSEPSEQPVLASLTVRFVDGPWAGTVRAVVAEESTVFNDAIKTESTAGYYRVRPRPLPPQSGADAEAHWIEYPSWASERGRSGNAPAPSPRHPRRRDA